jgi:hypothetical protein
MTIKLSTRFLFASIYLTVFAVAIVYIYLGLMENDHLVAFATRWIPGLLLSVISLILYLCGCAPSNRSDYVPLNIQQTMPNEIPESNNHRSIIIYFMIGFLLCSASDANFIFNNEWQFMIGMSLYSIAFVLFGIPQMLEVMRLKAYDIHFIISIAMYLCYFGYTLIAVCMTYEMVGLVVSGEKNNVILIVVLFFNILSMFYSGLSNLYNCFLTNKFSSFVIWIGIVTISISNIILIFNYITTIHHCLVIIAMIFYWGGLMIISISCVVYS